MGYTSSAINSSAWATYDMTVVLGLGTIIPINNTFYVYIKSAHTNPTEVHTLFQFVPVHESKARKRKERAEAFCGVSHMVSVWPQQQRLEQPEQQQMMEQVSLFTGCEQRAAAARVQQGLRLSQKTAAA